MQIFLSNALSDTLSWGGEYECDDSVAAAVGMQPLCKTLQEQQQEEQQVLEKQQEEKQEKQKEEAKQLACKTLQEQQVLEKQQ